MICISLVVPWKRPTKPARLSVVTNFLVCVTAGGRAFLR